MTYKVLLLTSALAISACGKNDDHPTASQTKTGSYAEGDFVKYQVHREGLGDLKSFISEARVTSVDDAVVIVEWSDRMEGDLSLITWNNGANPEIVTIDYNGSLSPKSDLRQCTNDPQTNLNLTVPAGAFDCVQYVSHCKNGAESFRYSGCNSNQIAIEQYVSYKKEWLDAEGKVTKWFERTLLEHVKH